MSRELKLLQVEDRPMIYYQGSWMDLDDPLTEAAQVKQSPPIADPIADPVVAAARQLESSLKSFLACYQP